jgi:hypothetical protein
MEVCTRVSLISTIALCRVLISLKSPAWSQTGSELTPNQTAATRAYLDRIASIARASSLRFSLGAHRQRCPATTPGCSIDSPLCSRRRELALDS